MRHHPLGRTGLFVSELCLGTMTFGGGEGIWSKIGALQQADAERLIGQALDAGINFIDTADVYSFGQSERLLGQALKNLGVARKDVVLATKVYGEVGPGPNDRGASRGHIMDGVKASLERLQTDHIDLYQIHGTDPVTPIDETLRVGLAEVADLASDAVRAAEGHRAQAQLRDEEAGSAKGMVAHEVNSGVVDGGSAAG